MFLCWLQAPDTNCNRREALFEPLARIAMASARSLNSAILFGGVRPRTRFASGIQRCAAGRHFSAIGDSGFFCVKNV